MKAPVGSAKLTPRRSNTDVPISGPLGIGIDAASQSRAFVTESISRDE